MATSHPATLPRRQVLMIAATAVVLPVVGCGVPQAADRDLRARISAALARSGHTLHADLVESDDSTLTAVPTPSLTTWRVMEINAEQGAHPILFHVGVAGRQALLLTGRPAQFDRMVGADDGRVESEAQAARLGRLYVETTRPAGVLTYVITSVDDIEFRPGLARADARYRDRIVERYRSVVAAPVARRRGDGFSAEVYTMRNSALQRRDLTITSTQSVTESVETLASGLPTPYVR